MKRLIRTLVLLVVSVCIIAPAPVYAVGIISNDVCSGDARNSAVCQDKNTTTNPLYGNNSALMKVANLLAAIVGIAAVVVIIVSGINYSMSQGDSSKVQSAKNAIIYATIGLVVVAAARSIIAFIVTRL